MIRSVEAGSVVDGRGDGDMREGEGVLGRQRRRERPPRPPRRYPGIDYRGTKAVEGLEGVLAGVRARWADASIEGSTGLERTLAVRGTDGEVLVGHAWARWRGPPERWWLATVDATRGAGVAPPRETDDE